MPLVVGVTGHRAFGADPRVPLRVRAGLVRLLDHYRAEAGRVVAVSGLAAGADTLFAEAAVGLDLPLWAVVPFAAYPDDFAGPDRERFETLLGLAARVERLPFAGRSGAAYLAAGLWVADVSDRLVAVWDGNPAAGVGGTGDVVAHARAAGKPVHVIPVAR